MFWNLATDYPTVEKWYLKKKVRTSVELVGDLSKR
jgi:hypothetical protein